MSSGKKGKYYITTAIAYTSGKPHIGNLYEIVLADAIARFKRLNGYDVWFQTGTDEHGQKVQANAEKAGLTPQAYVDAIAAEIRRNWDVMNVSYDRFIRTSDPAHKKIVQEIFKKLYEQDDIYKGFYEGYYCTPCESFFTESQLTDGKCPDCGRDVALTKEEAYFFRLSKYAGRLEEHIARNPQFIWPESRKNEMLNNFIRPGLQDLCVSRTSFTWGVPVDFDPGHVVYVWIDALSNYITFPGYAVDGRHGPLYTRFWPADLHLIGKDILRFHTIYWPIMLMALGVPLPKQVFGHPWLVMSDGKMSKSKGNVLYADDLAELFSVDAVRYFVLHETPFASDGTITHALLIERINSDLANILGNLVNRTVTMLHRYSDGVVGAPAADAADGELIGLCLATPGKVEALMNDMHVADAIGEVFALLRRANKYIDETTPWLLGKDPSQKGRLDTVLYNLLETIRVCAALLSPFLPDTAARIFGQLNLAPSDWNSLSAFGAIEPGHRVGQPEILFARLDPEKKLAEIEAWRAAKYGAPEEESAPGGAQEAAPEAPAVPEAAQNPAADEGEPALIDILDFAKADLRVALVTHAEPVPKSDKLLRLELDVGGRARQVVSGIAAWYAPADLIGRKVVLVYNLRPAKLRGVVSQGMILAAEDADGTVRVVFMDDARPGAKVR